MKLNHLLRFVIISFIYTTGVNAQDIHFTMWDMSPLTSNPAFTGAFLGTVRLGGIYRDQYRSALNSDAYSTPSFYVDAPIIRGFRKNDWIGVGGVFFSDKSGELALQYNGFMGSASYHLALNKKGTTILTIGAQYGSKSRSINKDAARFEDAIVSGNESMDLSQISDQDKSFSDFTGGIMFKSMLNERMDFAIGYSMSHITEPDYNLFNNSVGDGRKRPRLNIFHGQFNIGMTDKWTLSPGFFYQTTAGANEIAVQAWNNYKWNEDYTVRGGLGYRLGDAVEVLLGLDYKALRVTAAYDVNISDLQDVTNTNGGFEIAAWYIIKIYKKPTVKPAILCPKL